MRVSIGSLDHGHDVCGLQAAGNWAEGRSFSPRVFHRSPERRTTPLTAPFCGRYSLASEYHRR